MGKWNTYILKEIAQITDCEHKTAPTVLFSEFHSVRTTDIQNGRIDFQNTNRVSRETYLQWTKRMVPKENDIILAREAPVGEVGRVPSNVKVCLGQRTVLIQANTHFVDTMYLLYYLTNQDTKHELQSRSTGSVVEHLNVADIRNFMVRVPASIAEQSAIASVLSSLDAKIDLLQRQNKTLESLAEALFRKWFVEDGAEGWSERGLLDLVELVGGGTPKTGIADYWGGDINWLSAKDVTKNHGTFVLDTEHRITVAGVANSSTKVLPKYATVVTARGTVGKYCILTREMAFSQSNYGIIPKIKGCWFFSYLLIASVVGELQASAYGSVFDTITTKTFAEVRMPMPDESVIRDFENKVAVLFLKMELNSREIASLAAIRDVLLPRLMCGSLRIGSHK